MVAFVPVFALAPLDFSSDIHSLQSHYSFAPVFALPLLILILMYIVYNHITLHIHAFGP